MEVKIENILFLDIETAAQSKTYDDLDEEYKQLWEKKSKNFKDPTLSLDEVYKKRSAILAEFGKIICISIGNIKHKNNKYILYIKSFYGHNEKDILTKFKIKIDEMSSKKEIYLCAHNGKEFDYPYICRRLLVNNLNLPKVLDIQNKKPWEVKHFDTLDLWKFGDNKNYTSLELLCKIFNIENPKSNIKGEEVYHYYWEKEDLYSIYKYCEKDVIALANLFIKIKSYNININETEFLEPNK